MGKIKSYPPVKLVMAVSTAALPLWEKAIRSEMTRCFSAIDHELPWYDFTHTIYYNQEMGEGLLKCFISFENLISADSLPSIKTMTNTIEEKYAEEGRRSINLDPGYICMPRLVLATTKDYSHRLYLGEGIFGDIHLTVRHGRFQPNDWTYPDYRESRVCHFFDEVREIYAEQLHGYDPNP